ncbi:uncharacterized protein LOC119691614 [Plutella xylostella]|uniref:uncharacterized protein LOC119691614 n=1 Tax=Plutella xylostella TaxID=51655 RepID=UPI0020327A2E|nr:uncharacterized protein LOC119691614 [Plutella xylostella]
MSKVNRSGTREVIFKVFQRCMAEFQAGQILWDLDDVYGRTASMTGISESTVRRIVDEGFKNNGKFETPGKHRRGRPKKEMDNFDICALRQKIQFFYTVQKEVPTLRKLQVIAKTDLDFDCSLEVLRKILKAIGFTYKKCQNNRKALIEQTHIAAKREEYLAIIKKNRDLPEELKKDIIYLDESYIHSSYKVTKCWQSLNIEGVTKDISKGKRYIIVHAGSEKGSVPNCLLIFTGNNKLEDYHSEMNAHNFTKWIEEKLIPNLHEPSIVVMDNAPYHSVITNKAPTSSSRVDEIKLWLLENNIDFDPTLRKPNLLSLVRKNKPLPSYHIDNLLGEYGHTVIITVI